MLDLLYYVMYTLSIIIKKIGKDMSKKETTKKMPGEITVKRPLLDSFMYWVVQLGLSVAAVAGVKFYLQPVDVILSNVFAVSFVALLFYLTYKLR